MQNRTPKDLPIAGVVGLTEAEQRRVRGGLSFSGAIAWQNVVAGSGAAQARRSLYGSLAGNRGYGNGGSAGSVA